MIDELRRLWVEIGKAELWGQVPDGTTAAFKEALDRLEKLEAVAKAAEVALPILSDFGRGVRWEVAGRDIGEPAVAINLREALAALDSAESGEDG